MKQDMRIKKFFSRYRYWSIFWVGMLCVTMLPLSGPSALAAHVTPALQSTTQLEHAVVRWDTWGVPHIYGEDQAGLFYAFGWAQMESHADMLLRFYGIARGRAAEYWGASYLGSDELVRTFDLPAHAHQWYTAQTPGFRHDLDEFVAGINAYAARHPDKIDPNVRVVLPVRPDDVLAHLENILFQFIYAKCGSAQGAAQSQLIGSNGWAVAPSHTQNGQTLLLANPHLSWPGIDVKSGAVALEIFYEAQLEAPGIDAYGAALVGLPVLSIAFNRYLSWTHTVNTLSICTIYRLTTQGTGYLFDGQVHSFVTESQTVLVKQSDGSLTSVPLAIRRSVQGPVVLVHGLTVAVRMVGVDQFPDYGALQEWWDMSRATSLSQFQRVLQRLQIPMFMVIYADRSGNIMSFFNGQIPVRSQGNWSYWQGLVTGDTSTTLWTTIHSYQDLPRVIDPPGGWVQNSNSAPWYTTLPQQLSPQAYPSYMAPEYLDMREQRGIEMLMQNQHMSFDALVQDKFSTHELLADRVLPELIAAAQTYGTSLAKEASGVLQSWDRTTNAGSRGAVLFNYWASAMQGSIFAAPWSSQQPLTTPSGLADPQMAASTLDAVASYVQSTYGSLDVPWGDVYRLRLGTADYPASGGGADGVFRVLAFVPSSDPHLYQTQGGDTYIAAVSFSARGVHAKVLITYGNSTQPGSLHSNDQLVLYAHNQLRDAWFTRDEVMQHTGVSEVL